VTPSTPKASFEGRGPGGKIARASALGAETTREPNGSS
jgi:hypothetical protein